MGSKALPRHLLRTLNQLYVVSAHSNLFAQRGEIFFMLETNLRIVHPGRSLKTAVRRAIVQGPSLSPDLLERACGVLRHRHGLAAVTATSRLQTDLLVATENPLPSLHLDAEEWELDVADAGEPVRYLS